MSEPLANQNLTHDLLVNAKAKITTLENWTQGHLARDSTGEVVLPRSTSATCWCAVGSLESLRSSPCHKDYHERNALRLLNLAASEHGFGSIPELNDFESGIEPFSEAIPASLSKAAHALVMSMFDKAIDLSLDPAQF
jgi:hypothetical protein